jgi:ATP-dependent Clp protease ATP-binding subunit ClpC
MPDAPALRTASRRARASRGSPHASSAEQLLELAEQPAVAQVLAAVGVRGEALAGLLPEVVEVLEPEPADWHLRLAQRGGPVGPDGDLASLLAIVRSADCHAYRLLQAAGADMAALRKLLIEQVRERGSERANRVVGEPTPRRVVRMSTQRDDASTSHSTSVTSEGAGKPSSPRRSTQATTTRPLPGSPRQSLRSEARGELEPSVHASAEARSPARAKPKPETRTQLAPRTKLEPRAKPETRTKPEPRAKPQAREVEPDATPSVEHELRSIDRRTLPPMAGRERELVMLADALLRRGPRPPLLVGEHGSGRTLLAMHLARVLEAPVFRLEAPTYLDEDQLADDLEAIAKARGIVVLDDLDRITSDTPPALLPALARAWASGSPRILTVLGHEGRARLEAWMPGILDTLDVLLLRPLDAAEVHRAVELAAPAILAEHAAQAEHPVTLQNPAHLTDLTRVADRFLTGLALPGRALDLLDLACARRVREGEHEIDRGAWIDIVCDRTGLPRTRVEGSSERDMLDLDVRLARQVVGHEHVLDTLAALVRRNRAGFSSGRPIASVLLLGPSGVGKTEIAKALGHALFERDDALLRLDMSEYAEAHAVARVVGAPPGYVGHEQGGALSDPMVRNPHRVVLLDEIEKSHRDVHQLLLQVFDEGRLTDGRGRTVDFRHSVIVMTSNLGAELMNEGEVPSDDEVLARARAHFPVELWNRIEAPLVLRPLTRAQMLAISRRLIAASSARLVHDRGIRYRVDDDVLEQLIDRAGIDPSLGARPLRHLLGREVESLLADAILRGRVRAGDEALVRFGEDGRLEVGVGR